MFTVGDGAMFGNVYKFFDFLQKENINGTANTTKSVEEMTVEELGLSRGQSHYDFSKIVISANICHVDDEFIIHLLPSHNVGADGPRKPPIMVRCLERGNSEFHIMESVQDIVNYLKPIGTATKRYQAGSCVLVYFYTPTCYACSIMGHSLSYLKLSFPLIPLIAIDAYKFPSFNTEFGIISVPTLMIFHQGRPIVKFRAPGNLKSFVTRHTGIKPLETSYFLMRPQFVANPFVFVDRYEQVDFVLILSWLFILSCAAYCAAKTSFCKQIVEMIKRNWRESEEAQLEHN